MANRIVVDPITRIEGHLRIEAEIKNGVIVDAFSSSTMVRGIESIVKGRDPRDVWAFVQRTCGVCTTVHALTSVRAVEDALGIVRKVWETSGFFSPDLMIASKSSIDCMIKSVASQGMPNLSIIARHQGWRSTSIISVSCPRAFFITA